ncbi:MAG: ROK family protein [Spirochaetota bacterium]
MESSRKHIRFGIDLGGTKIEIIALQEGQGEVYRRRVATPQGNYLATIGAICELVFTAEKELGQQGSVGIGIPGAISAHSGLVKNANSTCLIGNPLQQDLQSKLKREIRISNDANCMTVSEANDGTAKDANVVFGVIVGTGTGGGISIHKKVLDGANLIAGEWGHNPMPWQEDYEKVKCYCGKYNCIETYLSGPGFLNRYQMQGGTAESPKEILRLVDSEDELAVKALEQYLKNMAKALASVINVLDPDTIVVAGGLSHIKQIYKHVPELWQEYVFSDRVDTKIVKAEHGDSSGVRGAAWLWG